MDRRLTLVRKCLSTSTFSQQFKSGISLHSHTMHSIERLDRLPIYIAKFPIGHFIIEREIGRLHLYENRIIDFRKYFWTPPLSPREAHRLESGQIEKIGLAPLVSLSDHDNIQAGMHLRTLEQTARVPVSVEWSVPFQETEFHIGVHNLPASRANLWMKAFAEYTAKPEAARLHELLTALNGEEDTLVVLNHPFWDAEGVGPQRHRDALLSFLKSHLLQLHALELNGMRSRKENREVLQLGNELHVPVVSGGDRHGCEPNAVLNLSRTQSFEEFVREIRMDKRSDVLLMPQFFEPLPLRLIENAWHALSDAPGEFGRRHWMTRVFVEEGAGAVAFTNFRGTRFHRIVEKFRWVIGLVANPVVRPALRLSLLGMEERGL